jgi:hypothetical protein
MDKVQKRCNSGCYTPSSEPFRIDLAGDLVSGPKLDCEIFRMANRGVNHPAVTYITEGESEKGEKKRRKR